MAKTQAPFLSLGAKGQLAKTVVASTWKGIKTMRQYVVPANPRTSAQVAHREVFATIVAAWKSFMTNAADISAWNRLALQSGKPQSGFNVFSSTFVKFYTLVDELVVYIKPTSSVAGSINTHVKVVGTSTGDVSVTPVLYVGPTEAKLTVRQSSFSSNNIAYEPVAGDKFFAVVCANAAENYSFPASGIYPIPPVA